MDPNPTVAFIITHTIKVDGEARYEAWLRDMLSVVSGSPDYLGRVDVWKVNGGILASAARSSRATGAGLGSTPGRALRGDWVARPASHGSIIGSVAPTWRVRFCRLSTAGLPRDSRLQMLPPRRPSSRISVLLRQQDRSRRSVDLGQDPNASAVPQFVKRPATRAGAEPIPE